MKPRVNQGQHVQYVPWSPPRWLRPVWVASAIMLGWSLGDLASLVML